MSVLRRWPALLLAFLISVTLLGCSARGPVSVPEKPDTLVVLHTNDHHGHPAAFDHHPSKRAGGLPARSTLIQRVRREHPNVLLLDAGDLNTGRLESNLFHAEPDIRGYNALGYDAVALGNHEFDVTRAVLRKQMARAAFPFLSANLRTQDGELLAQSHLIRDFDGLRVAVFGLTLPETRVIAHPRHVRDLVFEDPVETARSLVPELREKADLVIALTHLGIYPDRDQGSLRLAREVAGIDVIVDGHSHTALEEPLVVERPGEGRRTLVVQAWKWGLVLGKLVLSLREGRIRDHAFEAVPVNTRSGAEPIPEDPALVSMLEPYLERAAEAGDRVIGRAQGRFPNDRVREEETALGDLVADSMMWAAAPVSPDLAVQNGGGVRAEIPPGPVTFGRIHEVLPFDNTVMVLELRGRDVRALFERSASLEEGHGGFLQVSRGVEVVCGSGNGGRPEVRVNGEPMEDERVYRVVTNSFLASGGDGYDAFFRALSSYDTSRFQRDVLVDYIEHLGGEIAPETGDRLRGQGDCSFRRFPSERIAGATTWSERP